MPFALVMTRTFVIKDWCDIVFGFAPKNSSVESYLAFGLLEPSKLEFVRRVPVGSYSLKCTLRS